MKLFKFYLNKSDEKSWHIITSNMLKTIEPFLGKINLCITIDRAKRATTDKQRAYLFGVVYPLILLGLKEQGNDDYQTTDDVHLLMKLLVGYYTKTKVKTSKGEKKGIVLKSISSIKGVKYETWEYSEACVKWAAEYLGVVIPDPD